MKAVVIAVMILLFCSIAVETKETIKWPDYKNYSCRDHQTITIDVKGRELPAGTLTAYSTCGLPRGIIVVEFDYLDQGVVFKLLCNVKDWFGDDVDNLDYQLYYNGQWVQLKTDTIVTVVDPELALKKGKITEIIITGTTTDGKNIEIKIANRKK